MPTVDELISQALTAPGVGQQKQAEVRVAAQQKQAELAARPNPLLTIGQEALAETERNNGRYAYRSLRDAGKDSASGIGLGLVNSLLGIGSLGLGAVSPEAGAFLAEKSGDLTNFVQDRQSAGLYVRRQANAELNQADLDRNAVQAEQDKQTDGDFLAGLKRIGRDTLSTVTNMAEDPAVLGDAVSSGVGSLLVGGPASKVVRAGGASVAGRVAATTGSSRAGALIARATDKAAMPVTIGGLEAGGAYQGTVQEALNMGATPEEANAAGMTAAAIQAPIGAATGALVSKFEAAPFRVPSLGSAAGNIIRETVEEGIQSGSGQLAQNIGLQREVDPSQDLLEGVGAQTGQGLIAGAGTAGVVQTPSVAGRGVATAASAGVKAATSAAAPILARGDRIIQEAEDKVVQEATDVQVRAATEAPELNAQIQEAMAARTDEKAPQMAEYASRLFERARFDPAETASEAPVVQQAVQGATDRFAALRQVAQVANNPAAAETDRAKAGAWLLQQYKQYNRLLQTDLNAAVEETDDADPLLMKLREFEDVVLGLRNHPEIDQAIRQAYEVSQTEGFRQQLEPKAMATPEGRVAAQQAVDAVLELVTEDPGKADPQILDTIRAHAVAGRVRLTREQRATLVAASSFVRATRDRLNSMKDLGLSSGDQVAFEVQTQEAVGDPEKSPVQSASAKARAVWDAVGTGDLDLARLQLRDLSLLAQHLQNKVEALNANYVSGRPDLNTSFEGLSKTRQLGEAKWTKGKPVFLRPTDEKSVRNAQNVAIDARAVAELTNGLATAFPELGIQRVAPVALGIDPKLERKATEIVKEHRQARNKTSQVEVNSNTAPEKVTTPVVEPSPDTTEPVQDSPQAATEVDENQQPLPFEKPVEPLKEAEQPLLPLASEAEVAEAVPESPPVEPYADLLGSKDGKNWFRKAFRVPEEVTSRLAGKADEALSWIREAFSSPKAFEAVLGTKSSNKLSADLLERYAELLDTAGVDTLASMQERLDAFVEKQGLDRVLSDEIIRRRRESKALNLAEERDGRIIYNPELAQAAVLAGLQWVVDTATRPDRQLDAEGLSEILGIPVDQVTEQQQAAFGQSTWVPDAVEVLGRKIVRFWGVSPNPNAPEGFAKGIPEAVAKEVLSALAENGMIRLFKVDEFGQEIPEGRKLNEGASKSFNRVQVTDNEVIRSALKVFAAFPGAIENLVLLEPEEQRFIGEPPKTVPKLQMRNRLVRNSEQVRKAIEQRQNTVHKINTHMVGFLEALGHDRVVELFGAGKIDKDRLNINHARSLEGTNLTIGQAFDAMTSMLTELRSKAAAAGVDPADMPVYYAYNVSRVGRLQMQGAYNPQSNKLMREAVLPTRVTVDLSRPENYAKFALAIGQAWGEKVHKQPRETTKNAVANLSRGLYAPALAVLDAYLAGKVDPDELVKVLKSAFGKELSPAAVHAAMELARFNRASDAEKVAFTTDLYVEADGVTDGPINALVHLSTGAFTPRWIQLVAKGGLFLGSPGMTVNTFVSLGDEQKKDLYQTATDELVDILKSYRDGLASNQDATTMMNALLELMDGLLGKDLDFDGEKLVIQRGIAKNPLTITIYGSGAQGIANNIAGELLGKFYQELSKAAAGEENSADRLYGLLDLLTHNVFKKGEDGPYVKGLRDKTKLPKAPGSATQFTLSTDQVKNLEENLLRLFVEPLQSAIERTISDTIEGKDLVQKATQAQSIVLKHEFLRLVEEKLAAKEKADPDFHRSHFLSQNELEGIYKELESISPLVKVGGQILFVAGSENTDLETTEFSRSLTGDLSTPARVYGPKDAGVSGIPFLVISSGDGQMMLNLFTGEQVPAGALDVFDGVHLKLDTLEDDSRTVNKAVYDGWGNNPLGSVNESFQGFLTNLKLDTSNQALMDDLARTFPEDPAAEIAYLGERLQDAAQRAEARHRALRRVGMSVDHMASIEAPYQADGESLEGLTEAEMAHRLNQLMDEELLALRAPKEEAQSEPLKSGTPADAPPPEAKDTLEVLGLAGLRKSVSRLGAPAELKNLLKEAVRALPAGWEVVRGTEDQTSAYALSKGETPHRGRRGEIVKGYTSLKQQRVYLNTQDPETLLHELLHATTTQKILDHYQGRTTGEVAEAIAQLETLMGQWLELGQDLSGMTPVQRQAYQDAVRVVRAEQQTPGRSMAENKAAALDEFLAWNLSNQELIRIAQRTKVENPLARVVKRVLIALKNLIWGRKMAPMVRSDMYSALRFNASVLMNATPTVYSRVLNVTRSQSYAYGTNQRLTDLLGKLSRTVLSHMDELPVADRAVAVPQIVRMSGQVADAFERRFSMTPQERMVFRYTVQVFSTQGQLDPASLARAQDLFAYVNKTLTVEDFMEDPQSQNPADRYAAQQKFSALEGMDYVSGRSIVQNDPQGRSSILPAFMALAATNEEFRAVLEKMPVPKAEKKSDNSVDVLLTNTGNQLMDLLARTLSGEGRNSPNVKAAIDGLTQQIAGIVDQQESVLSQLTNPIGDAINGLNDKTVDLMQKGSKAAIDRLTAIQAQSNSKAVRGLAEVAKGFAAVANETESQLLAEGWISTANRLKLFKPAHDFINDLIGRTESNAPVYDMIKRVRSVVQQMRQQFREHLPGLIAERFSRELSKEEWSHLFKGLGKTDLAALRQGFSMSEVLEMLKDPARRTSEIRRLENLIEIEAGTNNWRLIQDKAQQLADFMNTGAAGHHLLRNAEAVARLYGVQGRTAYTPSQAIISRVDQLVTLYAFEGLDSSVKDSLASLAQEEAEGMGFTMSYLVGQRTAELSKANSPKARVNYYKGYIPSEPTPGAQLVVAKDTEEPRLRLLGYTKVADYQGSSLERGAPKMSYYFAPVASRALFSQGLMQNVRHTASGVDPVTGHSHGPMIAGRIVNPRKVQQIAQGRPRTEVEGLMPIFDATGAVIAYERAVDPNQETLLGRDQNLARMIGVWRGRQAEESLAGQFNQLLVENLYDIWIRDRTAGRADEFVDLFDQAYLDSDPVVKDAVSLFPPDVLEHIKQVFGSTGFMVRRDMINDAIGYRSPSVGDVWTGTTRLPPQAADIAKRLAVGVFGMDAYKHLVTVEKVTQNLVSEARQLIVVKSVVVPVSNFIANIYAMMSRGVSLKRIVKDIPKKLAETNAYVERRQRQIELEAELRAAEGNVVTVRRINAELQSLKDANKRMSIWPLIEAGEFSSISEAGSLEKEETTLFEGRLSEYIEQKVNKLPEGIRTAGRYALITKDTALFQGMRRAMEYGDFLAKAVTYDHLTQDKKLSPEKALARVTEEFVNYDRLSGRFRQGLENLGLLWFWNFKIRIAKIAVSTIRENPIHALLTSLVPTPEFVGSIGTPLSDNLLSIGLDGDLGWSIGPGMGLRSYEMNPWLDLVS